MCDVLNVHNTILTYLNILYISDLRLNHAYMCVDSMK